VKLELTEHSAGDAHVTSRTQDALTSATYNCSASTDARRCCRAEPDAMRLTLDGLGTAYEVDGDGELNEDLKNNQRDGEAS
jgi:hypothetical protein